MHYYRHMYASFVVASSVLTQRALILTSLPSAENVISCGEVVVRTSDLLGSGGTGAVYSAEVIGEKYRSTKYVLKIGNRDSSERIQNECIVQIQMSMFMN